MNLRLTKKLLKKKALQFFFFSFFIFLELMIIGPERAFSESRKGIFSWKTLKPGLETTSLKIDNSFVLSSLRPEIFFLRVDLKFFRLEVCSSYILKTKPKVSEISKKAKAIAAINANFYDSSTIPIGLVISNRKTLNPIHTGGNTASGIILIDESFVKIVHRSNKIPANTLHAAQAGPRLIANGKRVESLKSSGSGTRRSGLAVTSDNKVILFVTKSGFLGPSLYELQDILLANNLNIIDAINLDGGHSSQFILNTNLENKKPIIQIDGGDPAPIALCVYNKE